MPHCYFHMKLHHALHQQQAAPPSGSAPGADAETRIDFPVIEDRAAVKLALSQVIQGLGANRLDFRRAGRILYRLQIAAQLAESKRYEATHDSVGDLAIGRSGEELGPAEYKCDKHDDCNKCPFATKDQCTDWHYTDKKEEKPAAAAEDDDDE